MFKVAEVATKSLRDFKAKLFDFDLPDDLEPKSSNGFLS